MNELLDSYRKEVMENENEESMIRKKKKIEKKSNFFVLPTY